MKSDTLPTPGAVGAHYEARAQVFLEHRGLIVVDNNYRSKQGEIDLVMRDGKCLVFVEVRYRKSSTYGGSLMSISAQKQNKVRQCALHYLQKNKLFEKIPVRFDVVGVEPSNIQWVKDAF